MNIFTRIAIAFGLAIAFCSTSAAQWTYYAPQPTARWGHTCAAYNGLIYSVSGLGWTNMEVYNPGTNSWAALAPIPIGVAYAAVSGYNGKIYVMGGYTGAASTNHQIYTIATNTWSTGAALPIAGYGNASIAFGGKIYVTAGYNGTTYGNVQIYDVATNTWSTGATMPSARYEHGIGLIGNDIYVFGGNGATSSLEAYDIPTNTWTVRAPMINARYIHAGASDGALLHAAGGYSVLTPYETYNPVTNTWTARAPLQVGRYRVSGAVANGCFYVISGFNGSVPVNTVEGFCGFVVLPTRPDLHLQAREVAGRIQLVWDLPLDVADLNWKVERSFNGTDFETIGQGRQITTWWDDQPAGLQVWYRIGSLDHDGEQVHSNIADVTLAESRDHAFAYFQGESRIEFQAAGSAEGLAQLWSMDGKLLMQETIASGAQSRLIWSLAALPKGVYTFSFTGAGQPFQRKVVQLGE